MYHTDGLLEIIVAASIGTVGDDLFVYHAPAEAQECTILYPSNDPPVIDPDTPGYYCGKFQTIVRSSDYQVGLNKCEALSDAFTKVNTQVTGMYIKMVRPMYQARVYRRSDSGLIEFSVTYDIRYISQ